MLLYYSVVDYIISLKTGRFTTTFMSHIFLALANNNSQKLEDAFFKFICENILKKNNLQHAISVISSEALTTIKLNLVS